MGLTPPPTAGRDQLLGALRFAQDQFARWQQLAVLPPDVHQRLQRYYAEQAAHLEAGQPTDAMKLRPADQCWSCRRELGSTDDFCAECGAPTRGEGVTALRHWVFLCHEVNKHRQAGRLPLAVAHACMTEGNGRIGALRKRLDSKRAPLAEPVISSADPAKPAVKAPPPVPVSLQRPLMEILLDPRNIQYLLVFGAGLMVVGLVILLWVNDLLTPPLVALSLGAANAGLLVCGWYVFRGTRHQVAGRALTLLACMVMPLNLWYYQSNGLLTLENHLWLAALAISGLYLASALVLRDEVFVYVLQAGVTLTGLLILAGLPPSPTRFWEIALPSAMLVGLGVVAIHLERAFAEQEGPFGRRRFGMAFFWSGHAQLAAGLVLLLGAFVAGDWLYRPVFERIYTSHQAGPSPVVGDWRVLSLLLVLAGTYAYVYSDIVVRRVGVYVHIAAFTLMWAMMITVEMLQLAVGIDVLIGVLAVTALAVNLFQAQVSRDSPYTRAFPVLGVLLPLLAVLLGLFVYFAHLSADLRSVWRAESPSWGYIAALALTAVSCRVGAYLHRERHPQLSAVYFFATGAATLTGAVALLAACGLKEWGQHAPILMLLPILYLVAARLYRGRTSEQPLLWVSHAATAVMLISSLASAVNGFSRVVEHAPLNLSLALFFAEVVVYYGLAARLHQQAVGVHLAAAMACATVWQLMVYAGVSGEYYVAAFALVGLLLLVGYRFAVVDRLAERSVADAAFQSANVLLSLSFVASALLSGSRLLAALERRGAAAPWSFIYLCLALTLISLLAVALVQHRSWRSWYVVTTVGEALLAFLGLTVLSELTQMQKLEIFSVGAGLLLLIVGHVGWYREQDRHNDLVSVALFLGSLLVSVPLAFAAMYDRANDEFRVLNEVGFLAAGLVLLSSGFVLRLRTTTLVGAGTTALYIVTLLILVRWRDFAMLQWVATAILVGGGTLFGTGLLLSIYRDRLLALPDRIKRREGVFRVLSWR